MIRIKVLIFSLCFALLGSPIAAIASDISNALYFGTIIISNNSTANTSVATVANISTTNLITGQYLNATANNCVMRNSSGADVPFMPGYTPTNPWWSMWVPTIGEDSYLTYLLYTDNSFGGEIRYFPDSGGMSTSDDVTMEWGDDFESAFTTVLTDTTGNLELLKKRYSANFQNYESGLLAGMYFFEPIDVTPNIQVAWTDVDVSRYIPAGATGVILELDENGSVTGFRKNGSTDDRRIGMEHNWVMVGVDADLIFEAYMSAGGIIYLIGYTDDNWTYFTNAVDVSLGGVGVWTDIDVSASAPNATAAIIDIYNTGGAQSIALRKKGSADNRYDNMNNVRHYFNVVGLDDDQVFQGQIQNLLIDFFLVGYCTAGGTFDTNLPDKSLAGAGIWLPIDCSAEASGADFLLFEVFEAAGGALTFGFRANGSVSTTIQMKTGHSFAVVPCDDGQIVEGYVQGLGVDFFLIGGITSGAEQPYQTHALAAAVSVAEHDIEVAIEAEPDMSLWASDVTVGVSMGQGILPVKLIFEEILTAPAASVTFSGITGNVSLWDTLAGVTSRHLVVMVNAFCTDVGNTGRYWARFNGDVGANYNFQTLQGDNALPSATVTTGATLGDFGIITEALQSNYSGGIVLIPHAFNATNHKSYIGLSGAAERSVKTVTGRWADTSAIDEITLGPNSDEFATGSTFLLGVVDERYLVEEAINPVADFVVDFNNITGTGHDLVVVGYSQSDLGAVEDEIIHEINNDAHAPAYPTQKLTGRAGVPAAAQQNDEIGMTSGDNAAAEEFGALLATYSQYAEGTNQAHYTSLSGYHESTGPTSEVRAMSGRWPNVAAITQLEFYPNAGVNFKAGSLFSLYRVPRYVIDRQELTAVAPTITFNNIPQNYQALQLNVYARSDDAIPIIDDVAITLNTDAGPATFDYQYLEGSGAGLPTAARSAASNVLMTITAAGEGANEFGGGVVTFNQYSNTVGHKHFLTLSGTNENQVILRSSRWENTAAITRIDLDPVNGVNFVVGSVFELVGLMPTEVFDITVDGEVKGLADGNFSAEDNGEDWVAGGFGTPYFERYEHTVSSVLRQRIEWRYNNIFEDLSGNSNNATPTFRGASADADIIGNMTAFTPISQAQAPPYVLGSTNPFFTTAPNITGNFTLVPPPGTFPLAGVIAAIANATATPPQLPLLIIAIFVILAASLTTSYTLRRFGSGTLIVKSFVIIGIMGIFIALGDFGIDWWMTVTFAIIATALAMASRQQSWQ